MKWFTVLLLLLLVLVACQTDPPASKPTISTFSGTPATLEQGSKGTLSWQVSGADTLVINPDNVDVTGKTSLEVSPFVTTTYTLTATNTVGNTEATTIVTVNVPPLEATVNPVLTPTQPSLPDKDGQPRPVGTSQDAAGVQSDFVLGEMLIHPESDQALQDFLTRYDAKVIYDNTVPEPPEGLGITLTPEERKATEYLVRFNLAALDISHLKEDAAKVGLGGLLELSSDEALRTLAGITDAAAAGFSVSANFAYYPDQAFPTPLFRTNERNNTDAFSTNRFQASGSQSNITLAWQFVAAHGIQRRARVAIIDGGFWLDASGRPLMAPSDGSDLPTTGPGTCVVNGISVPCQYDFVNRDEIAGDMNPAGCSGGSPCPWHGNGSAGVALGIVNNGAAAAGTGGLVADPLLLHTDIRDTAQRNSAIITALLFRADVINMSFGGRCNYWCRRWEDIYLHSDDLFQFANARGVVLVASAGNDGIDVVDDNYIHPCLNDSVICVGAISDGGNTAFDTRSTGGWASNFGSGVDIWAPTNIPAMADGASGGNLPNFNGTSASAPFVAGVAAMMKAINPALNSDQVNQILRDTAHRGAAPVDFYIDAYAAVRKAAEGIDGVKDRFEPNAIAQLSGSAPWSETNLNLHNAADRDTFGFEVPQRSTMTIEVQFPEQLGEIPLNTLQDFGECGAATLVSKTGLEGGGSRATYKVPPGPYQFNLGGGLINAYNLKINLAPGDSLGLDDYEPNNDPASARFQYTLKPASTEFAQLTRFDPTVTLEASLHNSSDVDYYRVRGVTPTLAQQVLFLGGPFVSVYNNESPVTLEVYNLNADNTQGSLVQSLSNQQCNAHGLAVVLESGKYYLIKISGGAGRYTLFNGVKADPRNLPSKAKDRNYEVLHPGDPIEHVIRNPLIYLFNGDKAFTEINVKGKFHLELSDFDGNLLAEGTPGNQGFDETLSLAATQRGAIYALEVTPLEITDTGTAMSLSWGAAPATRSSENLILNPGAEEGPGNDSGGTVPEINNWVVPSDELAMPTVSYYNSINGLPSIDDPGPDNRGNKFFAGGPSTSISGIRQTIEVNPDWSSAIDNGSVKFNLSGFLGGFLDQTDDATLAVTFLGSNFQEVGKVKLGPITPREREDKTGLFPVAQSDYVPSGTRRMYVDLEFRRDTGDYNDGYADNLELAFSDYTQ
jgi:Subtilase family